LAEDVYMDAENVPQTETARAIEAEGYVLDGFLLQGLNTLHICFNGSIPCVLKHLTSAEYHRAKAFEHVNPCCKYVVSFELLSPSASKQYMVMPLLPSTLEHLSILSNVVVQKLWEQMELAAESFHSVGFAYMDFKPSNICINSDKHVPPTLRHRII
jgi:hypothetical protein